MPTYHLGKLNIFTLEGSPLTSFVSPGNHAAFSLSHTLLIKKGFSHFLKPSFSLPYILGLMSFVCLNQLFLRLSYTYILRIVYPSPWSQYSEFEEQVRDHHSCITDGFQNHDQTPSGFFYFWLKIINIIQCVSNSNLISFLIGKFFFKCHDQAHAWAMIRVRARSCFWCWKSPTPWYLALISLWGQGVC